VPEFVEAHRSVAEHRNDQNGPFVAHALQNRADSPAILAAVWVPWFQKGASLRACMLVS
jgi:hypothetical protein